jgi:hypothetical protein
MRLLGFILFVTIINLKAICVSFLNYLVNSESIQEFNMHIPKQIISGGQTGVDRGALLAAKEMGISTGGWCPPKREAEDGKIPLEFALKETPYECSEKAAHVPQ